MYSKAIATVIIGILLCSSALLECHYLSPYDYINYSTASLIIDSSVSLSVSPTKLEKSGEWITITWTGVVSPSENDWIGVYSPPVDQSIDPSLHAPIKFQYASYNSSHMKKGQGSLRFRLVNMREDVIVGFFRGGFEKPVLTAVSETIQFSNPNEPLQGHLALTGDPTKMILVWVTKDTGSPQVLWGTKSAHYTNKKEAESSTYTAKDMCGSPATGVGYREAGMLHQVTMDGLIPGTVYYYKFGDENYGWSEEYMFRAAPSLKETVNIVAYGDMGNGQPDDSRQVVTGQQPALNTTKLVLDQLNETDVVLHIGDISYARGFASVWDEFFDQIQPVATRVPYMVCIGNHERDFPDSGSYFDGEDSGGECGVPHERRFPMPRPSIDEAWYGFDYGPVHFLLMSTEHDFLDNSTQYKYLSTDLKAVDRSKTPWLVFAGHRPMYIDSTNSDGKDADVPVAEMLRTYIEPLLKEYKVDLALWGHHHSYQRTCPVYREQCTSGGTTHVVIGMGGQGLSKNISPKKPVYMEVVDVDHWGYSRFSANSTALKFQFIRDMDGKVHDEILLKKTL